MLASANSGELKINNNTIKLTNLTKILWPGKNVKKIDLLHYLNFISSYFLPFLKDRVLTTIRYPNGIDNESFYQKNCPDYAPSFIETNEKDKINYIVCQNLETLMWLGNQAAIEYHVPFSKNNNIAPSEIVFDLDPPSRSEFALAVEAAIIIKETLDNLQLKSFVKTSGNKGLQVYIPIEEQFSYKETRIFTSFISDYLIQKEPNWFTTERLKQKRGNRLYVDYVQHAEGKTIISPYSLRANQEALVATPLFWTEVNDTLKPTSFPIESIEDRIKKKGCPFSDFFKVKNNQPFKKVLNKLYEVHQRK